MRHSNLMPRSIVDWQNKEEKKSSLPLQLQLRLRKHLQLLPKSSWRKRR